MSRAPVVDERYRLQPADLQGLPLRTVIHKVTYQGLEQLTPVLHFADLPLGHLALVKHLALDAAQCRELIRLTRSSFCGDWVGQTVELRVTSVAGKPTINLATPTPPAVVRERLLRVHTPLMLNGHTLLLITLLVLVFVALFLFENSTAAWQWIEKLLP